MPEVGQRTPNSVVTPARILAGETYHQRFHLGFDARTARIAAMAGTVELASDQSAVPVQDGLRLGGGGDLLQFLPTESLADFGQCGSFRIGEPKSRGQVCS